MVSLIDSKKFDLKVVAERLERAKGVGNDGVSFEAFALREMETVLQTCLAFNRDVPEYERYEMIRLGVFRAGENASITPDRLLAAITALEKAYLATPRKTFVLMTAISVVHGRHLRPVRVRNAEIRFFKRIPPNFDQRPRQRAIEWPSSIIPDGYTTVTVNVRARGPHDAFELAIDILDYVRGIWNFALNRRLRTRIFSDANEPINRITLGPYRTIHDASGALALQTFWRVPSPHVAQPASLRGSWPKVTREATKVKRHLRNHPYAAALHRAFVRYGRALDGLDFDAAYLKLWSVLEFLTHTTAHYDETIRRTLFLFAETEVHKAVLEHLRHFRNAMVHEGASVAQTEAYTLQVKRYVETLLAYHLQTGRKFKSLVKAGEFLSHPQDQEHLRERLRLDRLALQVRGA